MKVSQHQVDDLHGIIKVEVSKADYQDKVEEKLRDYRKRANIPGFRPGMVPMGLIRKQYAQAITFDEVNHLLSHKLSDFIKEKQLNLLGQPLPVPNDDIDWSGDSAITFEFEVGFEPEIKIELEKIKGITRVEIEVTDKMVKEEVENLARRHGKMIDQETAGEEDFLMGLYRETDAKGQIIEGGLVKEGSLPLRSIESKSLKNWTGKKAGESAVLNLDKDIKKDFNRESITGFSAEELANRTHFVFEISKISKLEPAEVNQELFDKAFGEGVVTDVKDFEKRVRENLEHSFKQETIQHFFNQVYEKLMETKFNLPDNFLKKWIQRAGEEELTEAQAEEQYPDMVNGIKWQLIRDHILQAHDVQIDEQSMIEVVKERFGQFAAMGGENDQQQEMLNSIAKQVLQDEEQRENTVNELMIRHLMRIFEDKVSAKSKKMTWEKFVAEVSDKK